MQLGQNSASRLHPFPKGERAEIVNCQRRFARRRMHFPSGLWPESKCVTVFFLPEMVLAFHYGHTSDLASCLQTLPFQSWLNFGDGDAFPGSLCGDLQSCLALL